MGWKYLDGDRTIEPRVARPVDFAHAASPNARGQLVRADPLALHVGRGDDLANRSWRFHKAIRALVGGEQFLNTIGESLIRAAGGDDVRATFPGREQQRGLEDPPDARPVARTRLHGMKAEGDNSMSDVRSSRSALAIAGRRT